MPALTFTADSTTDQLAITGHNLNTGDGPAVLYTATGTLPTFSPALSALQDVYIIRVDADHVKLATSSANAVGGTFLDITANGSGTLQLLIGVPYRRPRTYAPGVQIFSTDLNANFDEHVALWNLLTAQAQSVFSGVKLAGDLAVGGQFVVNGVTSPATITGSIDINDWAPTGLSTAATIRQAISNSGVGFNITGLTGGVAGRRLVIHMLGTGGNITLKHENAGSSAANRFSFASGSDLAVPQLQGCVQLEYDGTSSRWRCIGKNF